MNNLRTLGINKNIVLSELLSENFNPSIYGMTKDEIVRAEALRNILKEYLQVPEIKYINKSEEAVRLLNRYMRTLSHEEVWVTFLKRDNSVISTEMIHRGGLDIVVLSNRDILAKALSKNASSIIVYHNHPSGTVLPSESDINATRKLKKACEMLSISLIDHLIVGSKQYYSFTDELTFKY